MIKFGTDGWRAEIARDFTFENVRIVALAVARYLQKNKKKDKKPSVVVGYDTRFLSKEFALETAIVLASQEVVVHLTSDYSSTPQVSFHTKQKGVDLGIVITASHNPGKYNGFKIKANFGGPATPEQIDEIQAIVSKIESRPPKMKFKDTKYYYDTKLIREFDSKESYLRYIKKKIDIQVIKEANFKILYDPMHGAGINTIKDLLPEAHEIHSDFNPSFGEIDHPEPIAECLGVLIGKLKSGDYNIGIATDGDADRLGLVDGEGNYVDAHRVFMIIMKYIYEVKKKKGVVAKTVSLTSMVDAYCEKHNITLLETAVGFKHIAKIMSEQKTIIGGEESGGLSTAIHIPERDGIFNAMLVLEMMAVSGKSLKQLSDELDNDFGTHRFQRRDVPVTESIKKQIQSACEKSPSYIGKYKVIRIQTTDGYKFFFANGWLLIRFSGTEPLLRFYSEADSMRVVNELLDEGMKLK